MGRQNVELPLDGIRLAPGLVLEDDWFAVGRLDSDTLAIGEPAYHQRNWSYLIGSSGESLLFDTGSGRRSMAPVVRRHSHGRVTAFPSHMHFDHLGGIGDFGPIIVADLPLLRACAEAGRITPSDDMFLGHYEDLVAPTFEVARWVTPGASIEVGMRTLEVLHTPGHSPDSVSLWEPAARRLYAADFIYRGPLYAQTPGASLLDYLDTCERLLALLPRDVEIVCAHARPEPDGLTRAPRLGYGDIEDVRAALLRLRRDGVPEDAEVPVNASMTLMVGVEAARGW